MYALCINSVNSSSFKVSPNYLAVFLKLSKSIKPLLFCIKKFSLTKLESLLTEKLFLKRLENEKIKDKKLDPKLLSNKHMFFDTLTDQIKFSANKFQVVLLKAAFFLCCRFFLHLYS